MNHSNHILNDLVSATRDGKSFYEHAETKVKSPELKALFARLAKVKGEIVKGLSSEIRAVGETPAEIGTWSGDFHKLYGDIRASIGDKNYAYVARLEDSEDRLLKAFEKALNDATVSASAHAVIRDFMPEVRICHDIMRARKIQLQKAA
jgi:uncharacterized protein (TIGR02284 family)